MFAVASSMTSPGRLQASTIILKSKWLFSRGPRQGRVSFILKSGGKTKFWRMSSMPTLIRRDFKSETSWKANFDGGQPWILLDINESGTAESVENEDMRISARLMNKV